MPENLENNSEEIRSTTVGLTKDSIAAETLHQSIQARATLSVLLAVQTEILGRMKGLTSEEDLDKEREKWFKLRDLMTGEFAGQLKNVRYETE